MTNYPSDVTEKQFKEIEESLESARKKTKPRTLDLHMVFNAVLYVLKTGCEWRALPKDYPKWRSVHRYFQISSIPEGVKTMTVLETVLKKIGRPGAYQRWKTTQDFIYHRRRAKREEYTKRARSRIRRWKEDLRN